jgi:hypothetical protein
VGFVDESSSNDANKNKKVVKEAAAKAAEELKQKQKSGAADEEAPEIVAYPNAERPVVVGSSLLVLESPWLNILQQLPQPLARHRYGT